MFIDFWDINDVIQHLDNAGSLIVLNWPMLTCITYAYIIMSELQVYAREYLHFIGLA
jgi:hypothetical protein